MSVWGGTERIGRRNGLWSLPAKKERKDNAESAEARGEKKRAERRRGTITQRAQREGRRVQACERETWWMGLCRAYGALGD
jgi:hypothetical protein